MYGFPSDWHQRRATKCDVISQLYIFIYTYIQYVHSSTAGGSRFPPNALLREEELHNGWRSAQWPPRMMSSSFVGLQHSRAANRSPEREREGWGDRDAHLERYIYVSLMSACMSLAARTARSSIYMPCIPLQPPADRRYIFLDFSSFIWDFWSDT